MLLATFALAAAQPAAEPPAAEPPVDTEITVVANKLRNWRGTWRVRKGAVSCKTKRSTGDRAIDALGCEAMITCMGPLAPQWEEIDRADLPRKEMTERLNALLAAAEVSECFRKEHQTGIAALVEARRSKRS